MTFQYDSFNCLQCGKDTPIPPPPSYLLLTAPKPPKRRRRKTHVAKVQRDQRLSDYKDTHPKMTLRNLAHMFHISHSYVILILRERANAGLCSRPEQKCS